MTLRTDSTTGTSDTGPARNDAQAPGAAPVPQAEPETGTTPATGAYGKNAPAQGLAPSERRRTRRRKRRHPDKRTLADRAEAWVSRLSSRNNFWHRVCSMIWLPYAFRSGIRMKRVDSATFQAVLPFRKFNRNWYNAMAGAALLGNSEIAGGMYVFGICGGDYTVVCKHLEYKFLRPCYGPAIYRIHPREQVEPLLESKEEFNITLDLDIVQSITPPGTRPQGKDRRVGRCTATFHVTPKAQHKARKSRRSRE